MSSDNYLITDDDDATPCFNQDHKETACFGNEREFNQFITGQTEDDDIGRVLETDGGNILAERRKKLGGKKIVKQTAVKKKNRTIGLLSSKRLLMMYQDGSLAYTENKNQSQIKQDIDPKEILEIKRSKSTIIIEAEKQVNIVRPPQ